MSELVPVFVNDRCTWVAAGEPVSVAVEQVDAVLGEALRSGSARITDARGIALDPAARTHSGLILRVAVSSRQPKDEADAHP